MIDGSAFPKLSKPRRVWRWLGIGLPLCGAVLAAWSGNWLAVAWALLAAVSTHSAFKWEEAYDLASYRADLVQFGRDFADQQRNV